MHINLCSAVGNIIFIRQFDALAHTSTNAGDTMRWKPTKTQNLNRFSILLYSHCWSVDPLAYHLFLIARTESNAFSDSTRANVCKISNAQILDFVFCKLEANNSLRSWSFLFLIHGLFVCCVDGRRQRIIPLMAIIDYATRLAGKNSWLQTNVTRLSDVVFVSHAQTNCSRNRWSFFLHFISICVLKINLKFQPQMRDRKRGKKPTRKRNATLSGLIWWSWMVELVDTQLIEKSKRARQRWESIRESIWNYETQQLGLFLFVAHIAKHSVLLHKSILAIAATTKLMPACGFWI